MFIGFAFFYFAKINKEKLFKVLASFCSRNNFVFEETPEKLVNFRISGFSNKFKWVIENIFDAHLTQITRHDEYFLRYICHEVSVTDGFAIMEMHLNDLKNHDKPHDYVIENIYQLFDRDIRKEIDEMDVIPFGSKEFMDSFVTFTNGQSGFENIADEDLHHYLLNNYSRKIHSGRFGVLLTRNGILIKTPGSNHEEDVNKLFNLSEKLLSKF